MSENGFLFVETFENGLGNLNCRNLSRNLHIGGATVAIESLVLCSESGCPSHPLTEILQSVF